MVSQMVASVASFGFAMGDFLLLPIPVEKFGYPSMKLPVRMIKLVIDDDLVKPLEMPHFRPGVSEPFLDRLLAVRSARAEPALQDVEIGRRDEDPIGLARVGLGEA